MNISGLICRSKKSVIPVTGALLALSIIASLYIMPVNSKSLTLYEVLEIRSNATADDIRVNYKRLVIYWHPDKNPAPDAKEKFIQVQHAYEVLSDVTRRQNYDMFGVDDLKHVAEQATRKAADMQEWNPSGPLWEPPPAEPIPSVTVTMTQHNFFDNVFLSDDAWLIQLYSVYDAGSQTFAPLWEQLASDLEGMMKLGRVEISSQPAVAARLAERNWAHGHAHFPQGLPDIIGISSLCMHLDCLQRFRWDRDRAAILEFAVEKVLRVPRISLVTLPNVMKKFFHKAPSHKVQVLYLMDRGQISPPPVVRFWAAHFWQYTYWGALAWSDTEAESWRKWWGVLEPPAMAIFKDPLTDPIIIQGTMNSSTVRELIFKHRYFELPQLRSSTKVELGCDPAAYPKGGRSNLRQTWYCAVVTGKPSPTLSRNRAVMRSLQQVLGQTALELPTKGAAVGTSGSQSAAARAWKEKRLTLAWLDGAKQKKYCAFHLGWDAQSVCDGRSDGNDSALYLTIHQRKAHASGAATQAIADTFITVFKGNILNSSDVRAWLDDCVAKGDSFMLPPAKLVLPALEEEDTMQLLEKVKAFVSKRNDQFYERIRGFIVGLLSYTRDPQFIPFLFLLGAVGLVYLYIHQYSPKAPKACSPAVQDLALPGTPEVHAEADVDAFAGEEMKASSDSMLPAVRRRVSIPSLPLQ